jgi:drug/metabolite transporter (DMT)-like permease
MLYSILGKLASESLLSLYPSIVRNISISLELQMWSRFFVYVALSLSFVDTAFISKNMVSMDGIALAMVTIAHVYTSYKGFMVLESGTAYTLFYVYPILILLMAGQPLHPIMSLLLVGAWLLSRESEVSKHEVKQDKNREDSLGYVMIFLAALTEALIYFLVRRLKTDNHWNHVFLSYLPGAVMLTVLLSKQIREIKLDSALSMSLLANGAIGLLGYLLRFFAISRLSPEVYAPLSYFGIIMSHVYGVIFNNDVVTWNKILGTLFIVAPNYYLYREK